MGGEYAAVVAANALVHLGARAYNNLITSITIFIEYKLHHRRVAYAQNVIVSEPAAGAQWFVWPRGAAALRLSHDHRRRRRRAHISTEPRHTFIHLELHRCRSPSPIPTT